MENDTSGAKSGVTYRESKRNWAVLAGCCLMCAVGFTIPITCWTVMMTPIINDIGIGYTEASMYVTGATLASLVSFVVGPRLIRFGTGKLIGGASVLAALSFVLIASAPSAATILAGGLITGLAYPLTSLYTAPVVIKNWFKKRQGTFTAIALAFVGVGGVIFSPLATGFVAAFGWRTAMLILAGIEVALQMVVAIALVRLSPIPLGIRPYGATDDELAHVSASGAGEDTSKLPGITFADSFKTPVAWLALVVFAGLGAMATVTTNVNPMIQKFGYDAAVAGVALSFGSIGNITGKLVMGWATDKKGAQFGILVAAVMSIAGALGYIASFTAVQSQALLFAAAFVMGNGCCMATMMPPLVSMDTFGPKDYDRCYGFFSAIRGLIAAAMTIMVGRMVDATGTYMSTIFFWAIAALIMIPFAYLAVREGRKRWANGHASQETPTSEKSPLEIVAK